MTEIQICSLCGDTGYDLEYDEFAGRYVCDDCDIKREIGILDR